MAIASAQTLSASGSDGASSVSKASVTLTAGRAVAVIVGWVGAQTVTGVSDGTNTYTSRASGTHTADSYKFEVFTAENVTGGTYTITASFSAGTGYPWIWIEEISGCGTLPYCGAAVNYQASPGTGTDAVTSGTITVAQQPALISSLIYPIAAPSSGTSFSYNTGASNAGKSGGPYGATWNTEYRTVVSTGNIAGTWTLAGDEPSICIAVAWYESNLSTGGSGGTFNRSAFNGGKTFKGVLA